MLLTDQQKAWINLNRPMLRTLFQDRVREIQDDLLTCPREERDAKADLAVELVRWLRDIKVLEDEGVPKKTEPVI